MAGPKILMLTNAELGQANVFLSATHALRQQNRHVQVHIASFPSLLPTLRDALDGTEANGGADVITFHPLPGRSMFKCFEEHDPEFNIHIVSLEKPGLWNTQRTIRFVLKRLMLTWSPREYADIYTKISDIVDQVAPDVVLADMFCSPAVSAADHLNRHGAHKFKLGILSPNTLKEYIHHLDPKGAAFWKWPAAGSGIAMPVSYWDMPLNIYLMLYLIKVLVTNKEPQILAAKVRELIGQPDFEIKEHIGLVHSGLRGIDKVFIGCRAELDFPELDTVDAPAEYMAKIVPCGPILRPLLPIEEELGAWLKRRPVVFINLGSHCLISEDEAVNMARSLRTLLAEARKRAYDNGLSVLWKLKKDKRRSPDMEVGVGSAVYDILGEEIKQDRVRIVQWLTSEPNSILNTGNAICAINHGGANSYYEALCAGVPQIILPSWLDCYDYANRVERLGIGRWGSRTGAPRWIESELTSAMIDVVLDNNAEYTARTRRLADVCQEGGGGRVTVATKILEFAAT